MLSLVRKLMLRAVFSFTLRRARTKGFNLGTRDDDQGPHVFGGTPKGLTFSSTEDVRRGHRTRRGGAPGMEVLVDYSDTTCVNGVSRSRGTNTGVRLRSHEPISWTNPK